METQKGMPHAMAGVLVLNHSSLAIIIMAKFLKQAI